MGYNNTNYITQDHNNILLSELPLSPQKRFPHGCTHKLTIVLVSSYITRTCTTGSTSITSGTSTGKFITVDWISCTGTSETTRVGTAGVDHWRGKGKSRLQLEVTVTFLSGCPILFIKFTRKFSCFDHSDSGMRWFCGIIICFVNNFSSDKLTESTNVLFGQSEYFYVKTRRRTLYLYTHVRHTSFLAS